MTRNRPRKIQAILTKLSNVKPIGKAQWQAACPAYGHKTPDKHLRIEDAGDKAIATRHGNRVRDNPTYAQRWALTPSPS